MEIGFQRSFFADRVLYPNVVSRCQVFAKEFREPLCEAFVGNVRMGAQGKVFFDEKRVEGIGAPYRAYSLVTVQRRKDTERVFEPIQAFLIDLHSEPLSEFFLVVNFARMPKKRHLQACHGTMVGLLVEKGIGGHAFGAVVIVHMLRTLLKLQEFRF